MVLVPEEAVPKEAVLVEEREDAVLAGPKEESVKLMFDELNSPI